MLRSTVSSIGSALQRPEYIWRPSQIVRRIAFGLRSHDEVFETAYLPWGLPVRIRPAECMGRGIAHCGVGDVQVCEMLWRLTDPGDTAIDVGANIGAMTSLMALRAGSSGRVWSFEPHPVIHEDLCFNRERWLPFKRLASITIENVALSDTCGSGALIEPPGFKKNHGLGWLHTAGHLAEQAATRVRVTTLDTVLGPNASVGVMKIDVEGHEEKVLRGAKDLLANRQVRDIVFEEHGTPPTGVTRLLQQNGYSVYFVGRTLAGLRVVPVNEHGLMQAVTLRAETPNYLATIAPERALNRLKRKAWLCLRTTALRPDRG